MSEFKTPFHILDIVHSDISCQELDPSRFIPNGNKELVVHLIGNLQGTGQAIHVGVRGFRLRLYFPASAQTVHTLLDYKQSVSFAIQDETVFDEDQVISSQSLHGYQPHPQPFFLVEFKTKRAWYSARQKLQDRLPIYNGNQDPTMQFMYANDLRSHWVQLRTIETNEDECRLSNLDLDYLTHHTSLIPLNDMQDQPRLLICSYDLETYASTYSKDKKGNPIRMLSDPLVPEDVITMVASRFRYMGSTKDHIVSIIIIGPCNENDEWMKQPGYEVQIVDNEFQLLIAWLNVIKKVDPDILTAWNGNFFDDQFVYRRALYHNLITKDDAFRPTGIFVEQLSRVSVISTTLQKPYRPKDKLDFHQEVNAAISHHTKGKPPPLPKISTTTQTNTLSNLSWNSALSNSAQSNSNGSGGVAAAAPPIQPPQPPKPPIETKVVEEDTTSKKNWKQDFARLRIPGRLVIDPQVYCQANVKLPSYSLNAVSRHYQLGQKDDINVHTIFQAWENKDPEMTSMVAKYCAQDTLLPLLYMARVEMITDIMECAHVHSVTINDIITKGQQKRCSSLVFHEALRRNLLVPFNPEFDKLMEQEKPNLNANGESAHGDEDDEPQVIQVFSGTAGGKAWKGALVYDPKKGEHVFVLVWDFTSLYPSIMRAYNLDYSTIVRDLNVLQDLMLQQQREQEMKEEIRPPKKLRKVIIQEANEEGQTEEVAAYFVTKDVKEGILSTVLTRLIAERGKYKEIKANSVKGTVAYMLADTRQKQRKVRDLSMNLLLFFIHIMSIFVFFCMIFR